MNMENLKTEPQIQYLSQTLEEIKKGYLLIPKFQRPFVWLDDQRLDLLRSIYHGMPIGSIMVWRTTTHNLRTLEKIGGHKVPFGQIHPGPPRTYLLDGHQRLSTLYGALTPIDPEEDYDIEDQDISWRIYFDVDTDDFVILKGRKTPKDCYVPLNILLDSFKLLKFQRNIQSLFDKEKIINKIDYLASSFRNYKIAVVPISTNDLESVTVAFQRINSRGTPMSDIHMINALTWRSNFDLTELLSDAKQKLGEVGWEDLDEKIILACCKYALGLDIYKAVAEKTSECLKGNIKVINDVVSLLKLVARFLKRKCQIPSPKLIPYNQQVILLLAAFNSNEKPSVQCLEALKKWLWITSYTGFFSGASDVDLRKEIKKIEKVATNSSHFDSMVYGPIEPLPKRFDFRSARIKALLLLMAQNNPKDYKGNDIDALNLLSSEGSSAVPKLILESRAESISGPENRIIMGPEQSRKFNSLLVELDSEVLKSHSIPQRAISHLENNDAVVFLRLRRKSLKTLEKNFIESMGFENNYDF